MPREIRWQCVKTTYPDRETAEFRLKIILLGGKQSKNMPRRAYKCLDCKRWHLTSWTQRQWQEQLQRERDEAVG